MAAQRVVLITGASSGIGEAIARRAVADGARVVLAARSTDRLAQLAAELGGEGVALAVTCDVSVWEDVQIAVGRAVEAFGRVDVVVANAGVGAARGFANETPEKWAELVGTNVLGCALTVRASLAQLREHGGGHVVLVGAAASRRPPSGSLYAATKAAVRAMAEALRAELNGSGARVTLIEPGTVHTPFYDNPQADALWPENVAEAVAWAIAQPPHVDVGEVVLRATVQREP